MLATPARGPRAQIVRVTQLCEVHMSVDEGETRYHLRSMFKDFESKIA